MRNLHILGLSLTVSYFHSSKDETPGLVYDLMEQYRSAIVDRSILFLLNQPNALEQTPQGLLTLKTRKEIIAKINDNIFSQHLHNGQAKSIYKIMQWQVGQYLDFIKLNYLNLIMRHGKY